MPSGAARLYTPSEAAAVSDLAIKAVNNAIDKRIIQAARPARGGRANARALTADDVLRVKLWYKVGTILSQERRQRLFDAIRERPKAKTVKADELVIVDVAEARRQIAQGTRALEDAEALVSSDKAVLNGEPVFKGTRIPVRLIAAMLEQGADQAEVLDGYPKLERRYLELARIWSAAHPRRGRPRSLGERGLQLESSRRVRLRSAPRTA
jgi:uncharacterized protein (DUF433 family)